MDVRNQPVNHSSGFELWGFPGAGKSTQAELLSGRADVSLVELAKFVRSVASRPIIATRVMSDTVIAQGILTSLLHPDGREGRFARLAVCQKTALEGRSRSLIEEGLTHEIWRALYWSPAYLQSGTWKRFVPHAGPNVIVLNLNSEEALRRILTKKSAGPVNRELAGGAVGDANWERAVAAYEALLSELERTPTVSVRLIEVGSLDPADVSEEIIRAMNSTPEP